MFNEECPHPQLEDINIRGQSLNNQEIQGAIIQLEEVSSTLRRAIGLNTSNLNKNNTIFTSYLDPGPSTRPSSLTPHLGSVSKLSHYKQPCVGASIREGDHAQ